MAEFLISNFDQYSTWIGYNQGSGPYYSTPSTASTEKSFDIGGIPADAIIDTAVFTAVYGSPYSGAAIRHVDGSTFSGSRDVKAKLIAQLNAGGSQLKFAFKFRANGEQGDVSSAGTSHTATLKWSSLKLTVTWHMPASPFTLSGLTNNEIEAGQQVTANITPSSSSYSHRVTWRIDDAHSEPPYTITAGTNPCKKTFTIPLGWCGAFPSSPSKGTCRCTVETLSGSTVMGSAYADFTVKVPASILPSITSIKPVRIDGVVPPVWGAYVKTKSKVKLEVVAAGNLGSSITSVEFTGDVAGGATLASGKWTLTSDFLNKAGDLSITVTATDSRGRKTAGPVQGIYVANYFPPVLSEPTIQRCLITGEASDTGTYLRFLGEFSLASVLEKNTLAARAYYRQMPSGSWIAAEEEGSGTNYALTTEQPFLSGNGNIANTASWQGRILLTDGLQNTAEFVEDIPTSGALFDVMPGRFAVGKLAERDGFDMPKEWECYYKDQPLDERFRKAANSPGLASDGSYWGLTLPDGGTNGWVRTPQPGIIPYQNGGSGGLGTLSWPFNTAYVNTIYEGNTPLASKYQKKVTYGSTSPSGGAVGDLYFKTS